MNLTRNKTRFRSLIVLLSFAFMAFCIFVFQGCKKVETDTTTEEFSNKELIGSIEFEDYIAANIKLYSEFYKANSTLKEDKFVKTMRNDTTPLGIKYRTTSFAIDQQLIVDAANKKNSFLKKFQSFDTYDKATKKSLILNAFRKSSKLKECIALNFDNKANTKLIRLKNGSLENPYGTATYECSSDAIATAMSYSQETCNECSGFVFVDGSAFLYINSNATHGSTSYPGPSYFSCNGDVTVNIYNGNTIEETFHTHFNSGNYSTADGNTQTSSFPDCNMVILYNDQVYVYPFCNGVN